MLRIRLPFDPVIKFVGERGAHVPLDFCKFLHTPIVCHQHILVLKWVTIAFADVAHTGGTNMGNHAVGFHLGGKITEVSVAPGRIYRHKRNGLVIELGHIPTYAESISIERLLDLPRMKTLVD